ncbi:hypothetical protein QI554_36725 [Yinghuangia seranimata]|nr:hypothetical protein [Yinghuangia seranimata]
MLISYQDAFTGALPTLVTFQYNPTEVTRVFGSERTPGREQPGGQPRTVASAPQEKYSLKLELDATDGLEREAPITMAAGISPRIAALEMLMQPVGGSILGAAVASLLGQGAKGQAIPPLKVPFVLFAWGPQRITPVRVEALTVRETAFDALLNPLHATAEISFTVLRKADVPKDDKVMVMAAAYYQVLRETKAVLAPLQAIEMGG